MCSLSQRCYGQVKWGTIRNAAHNCAVRICLKNLQKQLGTFESLSDANILYLVKCLFTLKSVHVPHSVNVEDEDEEWDLDKDSNQVS